MRIVGILVILALMGAGFLTWQQVGIRNNRVTQEVLRESMPVAEVAVVPQEKVITMAAVGDVMLGRSVQEQMERRGDFSWPFLETHELLAGADITVSNLEAVVVPGCRQVENRFIFCMREEAMAGLTLAGFDVVSQANNHAYNYSKQAYEESVRLLGEQGIGVADETRLAVRESKGVTFGFLGFDDVSSTLNLDLLSEAIASASGQVEVLGVMVHWGVEYVDQPTMRQREVAQVLAEAGADIIIGSHPHWVQPAEYIGKTLVFWSLGNFVFDQMWSEETRQGTIALLKLRMLNDTLETIEYEMVPVKIYEYGQPRIEIVDSE